MSNYNLLAIKLGLATNKPKEKKRIPKVSEKRKKDQRKYRKIVKEMISEDDNCELRSPVCTGKAQGADHTQKRSPSNLTKRKNLKRSCNACNLYKELHPKWAIENKHSISKFEKKSQD